MLQPSGLRFPAPDPQDAAYPQPPTRAGHLSVEYDPRPTAARDAHAAARGQLEEWGLADQDEVAYVCELLVGEPAANALCHAATRFRRVLDAGLAEGGRGMYLVDVLARRWCCHRDGPGRIGWSELGTCGRHGCGRGQP